MYCCWLKKLRNPDLLTESLNLKIEIAKVVPVGKPNNNNSTEINIKQKTVLEIQISKDNPANEQNSNILTEIDMKDETILTIKNKTIKNKTRCLA